MTSESHKSSFTLRGRNPDVLTCIANLSNDEAFTPPELASRMLDTLTEAWAASHGGANLWADKSVTFLDTCTKSGVFLRECTEETDTPRTIRHTSIHKVGADGPMLRARLGRAGSAAPNLPLDSRFNLKGRVGAARPQRRQGYDGHAPRPTTFSFLTPNSKLQSPPMTPDRIPWCGVSMTVANFDRFLLVKKHNDPNTLPKPQS